MCCMPRSEGLVFHREPVAFRYAKEYGDVGGAMIKGDVEDLKDEPYRNWQGSFRQNVKALWVLKGWAIAATKETAVSKKRAEFQIIFQMFMDELYPVAYSI